MMKTSLLVLIAVTASASAGGKPALVAPKKAVAPVVLPDGLVETKIDTAFTAVGTSYDILDRDHAAKQSAKESEPTLKLKSQTALGANAAITPERIASVEYCWDRLPAAKRGSDTTAIIKLSVEPIGSVATATVSGDKMNPELRTCITEAAARWRFPVADAGSELEYAIALKITKL